MINQITSTQINQQHMYPQRERIDTKIDDQVSKPSPSTSLSSESSQRIVNDKIIEQLDKVLQKSNVSEIRTLDPKNYTPESVSKQILDFVKQAIDRAETRGEHVAGIIDQAKQGIDLGFEQAKNILTSLNALSGKIAEGVQKTYELINRGMEDIVQSFKNTNEVSDAIAAQSSSLSLAIQTQSGDKVNFSISSNQSNTEYRVNLSNDLGNGVKLSTYSSSYNSNLSISVSGSFNANEIAAVEVLLADIKSASDRFFDDNVDAAVATGLKLGFSSKELVGFSLELGKNQSEYNASQAYREIDNFTASKPTVNEIEKLLTPIQSFSAPLAATVIQIDEAPIIASKQIAEQLFTYFSQSNNSHQTAIQQLESLTSSPFTNITSDIFSALK